MSIHIKASTKGTFTAAAKKHKESVSEFEQTVLAKKNKSRFSTLMKKKAQFAKNAAGFNHKK